MVYCLIKSVGSQESEPPRVSERVNAWPNGLPTRVKRCEAGVSTT